MDYTYTFKTTDLEFRHTLTQNPNPKDFSMHAHTGCELYCFIAGKGVFNIEGTRYHIKDGDILIMNNTESHYLEIDPDFPYERCIFHFEKAFIEKFDTQKKLLEAFENREVGKNNLFSKSTFSTNLSNIIIHNLTALEKTSDAETEIITGFLSILSEIRKNFYEKKSGDSHFSSTPISQILNYIMENLDTKITLSDICKKFYISKSQLCRIFKKSMGSTVWNYITIKRLMKAKALIQSGEHPTKIYYACGFTDYSSFFRAYKKYFGLLPTQIK